MKYEIIELFATDDVVAKYNSIKPWEGCKKCSNGVIIETGEMCKCSLEIVLNLIMDVPKRYDIDFIMSQTLINQLKTYKNFLVLLGENKYIKLVAYKIGKERIKEDKLVKYVDSKQVITSDDIIFLSKADVIIFEDIFKKNADLNYKTYLTKRIDNNKETIFLGKTDIIAFDEDFTEIEIDSIDIKLK